MQDRVKSGPPDMRHLQEEVSPAVPCQMPPTPEEVTPPLVPLAVQGAPATPAE